MVPADPGNRQTNNIGHTPAGTTKLALLVLAYAARLPPNRVVDILAIGNRRKKMSLETMIGGLSRDEKLAAMDLIWRELATDPNLFTSPKWHEKVIVDRLENPASGQPLPLTQAKAEIKEAIDARR